MFYRRILLLELLKAFGGHIEKIRLQKLLFLLCNEQKKPAFHFLPYKYGCFSFQATVDLLTLKKTGLIDECETDWHSKECADKVEHLSPDDEKLLRDIQQRFSDMDKKQLIHYTYTHFPFYAINSTILKQNLNETEIIAIKNAIVRDTAPTLFTMGYEGKSLEEYINILLYNNITLLCDVRKNAFSMKYGYSKSTLVKACENVHITYVHIPGLGIDSSKRKKLETKEDYKELFDDYKATVLQTTDILQQQVCTHIQENTGRTALLCFEADPAMCHRSYLAEALISKYPTSLPLKHL
jgi:uncharacterized protein (DUF488 family)